MTHGTWWGRLFARLRAGPPARTPRRHRLFARPTLELLPDRDLPSSPDVGEVGLPSTSADDDGPPVVIFQTVTDTYPVTPWIALFPGAFDSPPDYHRLDLVPAPPAVSPALPVPTIPPPVVVGGMQGSGNTPPVQGPAAVPAPTAPSVPPPAAGETPRVTVSVLTSPAGVAPPDGADPAGPIPKGSGSAAEAKAGGPAVRPDTPVFRISGVPTAGEPLKVSYTLAAHDATGTVSVNGSATLTDAARPVTITPGATVAGRSPDILTLTVREQPGVRSTRLSATLFLTPVHRIADPVLLEAHRQGRSPEAFRALVQRHAAAVARVCQVVVGNRADAEDVSQFVFLELAKTQARFPGTLTGWLRTVARNASLAFLRARRRRLRHEQASAKPVAAEPEVAAHLDESLATALEQLPSELGEAVRLRYVEGYTQHEAARIVGCPRGTLSRRAAHGVQALRGLLRDPTAG